MDAISSIGGALKSGISSLGSDTTPLWQKILGIGAAGSGAVGNILASNKRNQVLNQQLTDQQRLEALAQNPALVAQNTAALEQPLSAGLTSGVGNAVQGYLAERGLSQAPGIQTQTLTQALAPFQQQEQQMAIQQYMQLLGLPAQASARFLPVPQGQSLSSLFQMLMGKPVNPAFGTPTPGSPAGVGVTTGPTMDQAVPGYGGDPGMIDMIMNGMGSGNSGPSSTGDAGGGSNIDFMQYLMTNPAMAGAA